LLPEYDTEEEARGYMTEYCSEMFEEQLDGWSGNILKNAMTSCSWASMPFVGGWFGQRTMQSLVW
jgi:hypothetical protein